MTIAMIRRARRPRAIDQVEADLLGLGDDESRAPEHQPEPGDDGELRCPADREIEQVAEDDLDDEGEEHRGEQHRRDELREAGEPLRDQPAAPRPAPRAQTPRRVDLLEHPLGPALREIGFEVFLLREAAEGVDIGRVDLEPLLLEGLATSASCFRCSAWLQSIASFAAAWKAACCSGVIALQAVFETVSRS